jgi:hypothetical protein
MDVECGFEPEHDPMQHMKNKKKILKGGLFLPLQNFKICLMSMVDNTKQRFCLLYEKTLIYLFMII